MTIRTEFPSPQELRGAVYGTIIYFALYLFGFIQFQSYTKFYIYYYKYKNKNKTNNKKGVQNDPKKTDTNTADHQPPEPPPPPTYTSFRDVKYYNTTDLLALNGDRTVGNYVEQAIVFLPLLWIHALFIDPSQSWYICCIYTAIRSIYPLVFYTKYMFFVTIPGYCILFYLIYQILSNV